MLIQPCLVTGPARPASAAGVLDQQSSSYRGARPAVVQAAGRWWTVGWEVCGTRGGSRAGHEGYAWIVGIIAELVNRAKGGLKLTAQYGVMIDD